MRFARDPRVLEVGQRYPRRGATRFLDDQTKGGIEVKGQIKGKAEELKGKATGNRSEELKGKARQTADKLRREGRDIREDLRDEGDGHRDEPAGEPTHDPR